LFTQSLSRPACTKEDIEKEVRKNIFLSAGGWLKVMQMNNVEAMNQIHHFRTTPEETPTS